MEKAMEVLPLAAIRPYENNPRKISAKAVKAVAESIKECGYVSPIVIDENGVILAGHTRYRAIMQLGRKKVEVLRVSGLTEEQKKKYRVLDNRAGEFSEWDLEKLEAEIKELDFGDFEFFNFEAPKLDGPAGDHFWGDAEGETNEEYESFTEKFKPKLTTDDCYTPANIYEAVRDWAVNEYGLQGREVIRPFYPGGDYENEEYPDGCVVIDNPPFSILSQICRWYDDKGIDFFLFGPSLTLFSVGSGKFNYIVCNTSITYENGAEVRTGFITNLGEYKINSAPELYATLKRLDKINAAELRKELPRYTYPDCVVTSALMNKYVTGMKDIKITIESTYFIRELDAQKQVDRGVYGGAFLLSDSAVELIRNAPKLQEEAQPQPVTVWELSEREKRIVEGLK